MGSERFNVKEERDKGDVCICMYRLTYTHTKNMKDDCSDHLKNENPQGKKRRSENQAGKQEMGLFLPCPSDPTHHVEEEPPFFLFLRFLRANQI